MAETINTQTTGYECVGIEKIEQTYEGLFDNKPNIITIYLTNGDTHQFKVMNGSQGVGIDRIEQRQTSTVSGGRNEFAIILTNGKEYTFSTYNGSGGSGSSGSFNQVLQQLNNLLMPSGKSYLYYNGSSFEWKSPDGSTGGGTADLSEYSWWGRRFDPESNSITGEMSGVTGIEFQSTNGETVIRKKLHLDNNGNLCFDGNFYATGGITALGSGGGTSGGSGVSLGTLLAQLNNENPFPTDNGQVLTYDGSNFVWRTPTGSGGSSSSFSYPLTIYNGSSNTDYITYDGSSSAYLKFKSGFSISKVGLGYEISVSGGGSGSSSRIKNIKLFNSAGESFETVSLGTADTIGFMAGNNISLEAVVKEYTNVIKISATGGTGGSGGSTSTSVSWENVTNKPSTFTPKSHTHSTNDITDLSNFKASSASAADRLTNAVTLWGNNFSGNNSIGTNSTPADLRYVKDIYAGNVFDIKAGNNSLLKVDGTPNIFVGFDYKDNVNASILLFGNKTTIFTSGDNYRYDFKSNVFDVNSNQIHFGSETNGGKISWDAANNAFKIEGNVYATGGITALGVSNNATTSNNVDFTFRSVTSPTYKFNNRSYLTETSKDVNRATLKLYHAGSNQYILLNNEYENIANDIFLGTIIDSNCMSFMNADWYYFDNSLVTHEIYTNKIKFCDTDGNQGATLSDIAISKVSNQTKLIFTIDGIQYYVNAN